MDGAGPCACPCACPCLTFDEEDDEAAAAVTAAFCLWARLKYARSDWLSPVPSPSPPGWFELLLLAVR